MFTEHRNLMCTLMLLLLSGVLCNKWKVVYQQQNICALKGSSVVIPCSFFYPDKLKVQSVKWAHERNHIYVGPFIYDSESNSTSSRYEYVGDKLHNCSVKIHRVERNDTGKHAFRFTTNSTDGTVQGWTGSAGSQLKIVDLKVLVTKTNGNASIKEGDSVNLTCINGCDRRISSSFIWRKNGQTTYEGPTLHLHNISSTNSGNYSCSLKTQRGLTSVVINIDAEYGPKNTSVSVRPSTEVNAGGNITLICSTNANPRVNDYTWFKKGHDDVILGNGPELKFIEIYPHDGGQYLCSVSNEHGHQNSSVVTIKVKANWSTFNRDVLIIATVAMVLIVTTVTAVLRLSKRTISAPKTTPETDNVEDIQDAVYINWPMAENSPSEQERVYEDIAPEIIYTTVDFGTKRKTNMQQQMDSHYDESVIYSTVCRDQMSNPS